jgi:regulator of protease activity HflC (stomatin/prohibitin superfamily)
VNLFDRILDTLKALWPVVLVYEYQAGVRFRLGRYVGTVPPGWYWCWWWVDELERVTVVEQSVNLPTQSVATRDGRNISFSANLTYEIADAGLYFTKVQDFERSLVDQAMIHLAQRVREFDDFPTLHAAQRELERSLKDTMTTRVKRWGVQITGVGLTDLTPARVYRLLSDPQF